jgi:hypothetical protein
MKLRRLPRLPGLRLGVGLTNPDVLAADPLDGLIGELQKRTLLAAELVRAAWADLAKQEQVHRSGAYIDGIRAAGRVEVVSASVETGAGVAEVVVDITNTAKHAHVVEVGHAAYSLPQKINWGSTTGSIKRSKDGKPYLHIPFRHFAYAAPGERAKSGHQRSTVAAMMPQAIYNQAKALARTLPQRVGPVYDASGRFVARDRYVVQRTTLGQPSRLRHDAHVGATAPLSKRAGDAGLDVEVRRAARSMGQGLSNPAWQSSKFSGMIKSGPAGHTTYHTIRTITPWSEGFRIPAVPGKYIVARLAKSITTGALKEILMDVIATGGKRRGKAA